MIEQLFVPYYIGVKLKNVGFNEECLMCYYGQNSFGKLPETLYLPSGFGKMKNSIPDKEKEEHVTAPLYQQVINWLNSKGIILRLTDDGSGYEVRAKEWELDSFLRMSNIDFGIIESLKLLSEYN